jgi:hypothetical protein
VGWSFSNHKFQISWFKRRYDLQFYEECVWVELPSLDCENLLTGNHYLLTGNHYFPPDASTNTIVNYFSFLENELGTKNYRVILMGDFKQLRLGMRAAPA